MALQWNYIIFAAISHHVTHFNIVVVAALVVVMFEVIALIAFTTVHYFIYLYFFVFCLGVCVHVFALRFLSTHFCGLVAGQRVCCGIRNLNFKYRQQLSPPTAILSNATWACTACHNSNNGYSKSSRAFFVCACLLRLRAITASAQVAARPSTSSAWRRRRTAAVSSARLLQQRVMFPLNLRVAAILIINGIIYFFINKFIRENHLQPPMRILPTGGTFICWHCI